MASRGGSVILGVSWAALLFVSACSQTTRYRVLSFFLDGVPPPGASDSDLTTQATAPGEGEEAPAPSLRDERIRREALAFPHPPYRDFQCTGCHDLERGALVQTIQDGLCQSCHSDPPGELLFVHGPVAVNACLMCHHHHISSRPKMLQADLEDICFGCHDADRINTTPYHEMTEHQVCIDCHNPHGGGNRFFLKQDER